MPLERMMVYADADDLAAIKDAAAHSGVSEAEIIRDAIHLAACECNAGRNRRA